MYLKRPNLLPRCGQQKRDHRAYEETKIRIPVPNGSGPRNEQSHAAPYDVAQVSSGAPGSVGSAAQCVRDRAEQRKRASGKDTGSNCPAASQIAPMKISDAELDDFIRSW